MGSGVGMAAAVRNAICEHPQIARSVLGRYAGQTAKRRSGDNTRARLRNGLDGINRLGLSPGTPLAIPAGVAEIFGYRLGLSLGVKVPRVELKSGQPTDEDCLKYFIKQVPGGHMLSERVPRSIPVYFLGKQCATLPGAISEFVFRKIFVELFDKRCPLNRNAYSDFPEVAPAEALASARWDSKQRLMQYVFRAFLHCTYPHTSNAIVDVDGTLWLIDFEKTYISNEDDITLLYQLVEVSDEVMELCQRVSLITPSVIEQAFANIPDRFWAGPTGQRKKYGVYVTPESAAEYFTERLTKWQEVFGYGIEADKEEAERYSPATAKASAEIRAEGRKSDCID